MTGKQGERKGSGISQDGGKNRLDERGLVTLGPMLACEETAPNARINGTRYDAPHWIDTAVTGFEGTLVCWWR